MVAPLAIAALIAFSRPADLHSQFLEIARSVDGRVGAAAMLVETGELVSVNGDKRFPMQSVYKAPIAMAVLERLDSGPFRLGMDVRVTRADLVPGVHSPLRDQHPCGVTLELAELLRLAIAESDGTASDVLVRLVTIKRVNRLLRTLGIHGMVVATTEKQMARDPLAQYRSWCTPVAAVKWLRALQGPDALSTPSRFLMLKWMTDTATGPHRIKGLLPVGTAVAHKTGTDRTRNGLTRATNDMGLITLPDGRHLAVAVFIADSRANEADREGAIARIARAAWDHWAARAASPRR